MVDNMIASNQANYEAMVTDASLYSVGNYVTSGTLDVFKTYATAEPGSEEWIDAYLSIGLMMAGGKAAGVSKTAGKGASLSKYADAQPGYTQALDGASKPLQMHHYASNKNNTYTPQFEQIIKNYGLDLNDSWNKDLLPHQGRHPNMYHDYVLDNMRQFNQIAQGDTEVFLSLYSDMKNTIHNNPEMLYKDYWTKEK